MAKTTDKPLTCAMPGCGARFNIPAGKAVHQQGHISRKEGKWNADKTVLEPINGYQPIADWPSANMARKNELKRLSRERILAKRASGELPQKRKYTRRAGTNNNGMGAITARDLGLNSLNVPSLPLRKSASRVVAGGKTAAGRSVPPAPVGEKCAVCGAPSETFPNGYSWTMHENFHVRKGEGRWRGGISRGPERQLVPTALGRRTFGRQENQTAEPALSAAASQAQRLLTVPQQPPQVEDDAEDIQREPSENELLAQEMQEGFEAMRSIQSAAIMVQFAIFMQRVGPERATAVLAGIRNMQRQR